MLVKQNLNLSKTLMKITLICLFCICSLSLELTDQEGNEKHYLQVILNILRLQTKEKVGKSTFMSTKPFKRIRSNRLNKERKEDMKKLFKSQKVYEYLRWRKSKKDIVPVKVAYQLATLQEMLTAIDAVQKTQTTWTRV